MEKALSPNDQQRMVSSFLEIAGGETAETARQFLQVFLFPKATDWRLEDAIQLFLINDERGVVPLPSSSHNRHVENVDSWSQPLSELGKDVAIESSSHNVGNDVCRPLPVIRKNLSGDAILYGASGMGHCSQEASSLIAFHNSEEEMSCSGFWESEQGVVPTKENSKDNLASLYCPPFHLMFCGPFDRDKWLLVNIQSTKEFRSHLVLYSQCFLHAGQMAFSEHTIYEGAQLTPALSGYIGK